MPLYRVSAPAGSLSVEQKRRIAIEFTDIHCRCTNGTPRKFVHVIFEDVAEPNAWTAGEPSTVTKAVGMIRSGRSRQTRQRLVVELTEMLRRITGLSEQDTFVTLTEVRPEDSMEWGRFLPEDGEESEWVQEHGLGRVGVHATE